jgi:alginate O-acetyltransferase complex protein AlgI
MLFNSLEFIFLFLPIALGGFLFFCKLGIRPLVVGWLILLSLSFYANWNLLFLLLLAIDIVINWVIAETIARLRRGLPDDAPMSSLIQTTLFFGVAFNIAFIGYFKYINFLIGNINNLGGSIGQIEGLMLPLGISFYTFEQISYLVTVATGKGKHYGLPRFLLFVTFFPHLIAGPILTADELLPQFRSFNYQVKPRSLAVGFTIFTVGLFKKTVIADSISGYATPIFAAADDGQLISFFLAWQAAIAYTLQLYFDFSGYSDMAIGLSKLFNIKLPINFFSPYKAISVGDFWRRWHITLSRFLRDYLYIPLGGSRQGEMRHYLNLILTMLLGGLWHGANWTFVVWGALHGTYLCIDSAWKRLLKQHNWNAPSNLLSQILARALTFLAVVISWVVFRAETLDGAGQILSGMLGLNKFILPEKYFDKLSLLSHFGIKFEPIDNFGGVNSIAMIVILLFAVFLLPNLYEIMKDESAVLDVYQHLNNSNRPWYAWEPSSFFAVITGVLFFISVSCSINPSEFLYFQF